MSKRRSRNEDGRRTRRPQEVQSHWGRKGVVFLDTPFRTPVSYLIHTSSDVDASTSALSVGHSGERWHPPVDGRRHTVNWRLESYEGADERLVAAVNGLIRLTGYKPNTGENRPLPYFDLLYLSGEVVAKIADEPRLNIALGKLDGFTILSGEQHYPIWSPQPE